MRRHLTRLKGQAPTGGLRRALGAASPRLSQVDFLESRDASGVFPWELSAWELSAWEVSAWEVSAWEVSA